MSDPHSHVPPGEDGQSHRDKDNSQELERLESNKMHLESILNNVKSQMTVTKLLNGKVTFQVNQLEASIGQARFHCGITKQELETFWDEFVQNNTDSEIRADFDRAKDVVVALFETKDETMIAKLKKEAEQALVDESVAHLRNIAFSLILRLKNRKRMLSDLVGAGLSSDQANKEIDQYSVSGFNLESSMKEYFEVEKRLRLTTDQKQKIINSFKEDFFKYEGEELKILENILSELQKSLLGE